MSEEEIYKNDLRTIYRIIEIHAEMNGGKKHNKKDNKNKVVHDDSETYIDNIKF